MHPSIDILSPFISNMQPAVDLHGTRYRANAAATGNVVTRVFGQRDVATAAD